MRNFKVSVRVLPGDATPIPTNWREILAQFPADLLDVWEERAAIIQFDGGEPRPTAERRAFQCLVMSSFEADKLLRAHMDAASGTMKGRA